MGQFDRQVATAQKLIAKNGQDATWRIINDPVPVDPDEPWNPGPAVPVDKTVKICFLPLTLKDQESLSYILGTEVPKGAVDFEPNLKDVVVRDGIEHRIATIKDLSPNGQKILYTMILYI